MAPQTSWATSGEPNAPRVASGRVSGVSSKARGTRVGAIPSHARLRHDARRCAGHRGVHAAPQDLCGHPRRPPVCSGRWRDPEDAAPEKRGLGTTRSQHLGSVYAARPAAPAPLRSGSAHPVPRRRSRGRHRVASSRKKRATAGVVLVPCGAVACACLDTCRCPSERLALGGGQRRTVHPMPGARGPWHGCCGPRGVGVGGLAALPAREGARRGQARTQATDGPRSRATGSEHVHDIRGAGGIRKQHLFERVGTEAQAHRHGKNVNHLFGVRPQEVGPENPLAPFLH